MYIDLDVHPESNRMAVLQRLPDGSKNIVIHDIATKKAVGEVDSYFIPQGPRFSPDGRLLAFFGDGAINIHDVESHTTSSVEHDPELHASFCEWSADGSALVYNAYALAEDTDRQVPPNIYRIDLSTKTRHPITENEYLDRFPQWSPNGRYVAFHRQFLDSVNPPKHLIVADLHAGTEQAVPKGGGGSQDAGRFCWSEDGNSILVKEVQANGAVTLTVIRLDSMEPVWSIASSELVGGAFRPGMDQVVCMFKQEIALFALSGASMLRKVSLLGCSPIHTWHVGQESLFFIAKGGIYEWKFDLHDPILFQSDAKRPRLAYRRDKYMISSRDGAAVPVLRLIPEKPNPVAVELVFGGPDGPVDEHYPVIQQLLQQGFEVVCPIYRGKFGAGKAHVDANIGEMGRGDMWDVAACGLDWKQRTGNVRPLALAGFSYGGLLTFLALADNPRLWAGGVTLWGVTDLDRLNFYKAARAYPADPAEREAERTKRSPLIQSRYIRTPLLMFHGGRDTTSTNEEVRSIQNELQANGVPCELTIFQDDTHGLTRHRPELFSQLFAFLRQLG